MSYSVWSRGRLIGHTDLEFVSGIPNVRVGWLHPTAEGESAMPIAVAMPPAMKAYVERARQLTGDALTVQRELDQSSEGADLAAAFNHLEALALQLHREDGSVVATEDIGIQDMHRLIALSHEMRDGEAVDDWSDVGDLLLQRSESELQLEEDMDYDAELIKEMFAQSDGFCDWAIGDLPGPILPRYQIQAEFRENAPMP